MCELTHGMAGERHAMCESASSVLKRWFHVSTEFEPIFTAQQNECGVHLSVVHVHKEPIHTIQSSLTISAVDFMNHVCCTGLFISPAGIAELDCATTKTDTAERSISIGRESLQVFLCTKGLGVLPGSTARG